MRITLGEIHNSSVSGLLVYCADYKCSHLKTMTPAEVDKWPDSVRLRAAVHLSAMRQSWRRHSGRLCPGANRNGGVITRKPLELPPALGVSFARR